MYYIVGDIGNSSTRICLFNKSKIIKSVNFETKNIFLKGKVKKTLNKLIKQNLKKTSYFQALFL